jgi:hypothetical protein
VQVHVVRLFVVCSVLIAIMAFSTPASFASSVLYGVFGGSQRSGINGGAIATIDPQTGVATVLGIPIAGKGTYCG